MEIKNSFTKDEYKKVIKRTLFNTLKYFFLLCIVFLVYAVIDFKNADYFHGVFIIILAIAYACLIFEILNFNVKRNVRFMYDDMGREVLNETVIVKDESIEFYVEAGSNGKGANTACYLYHQFLKIKEYKDCFEITNSLKQKLIVSKKYMTEEQIVEFVAHFTSRPLIKIKLKKR